MIEVANGIDTLLSNFAKVRVLVVGDIMLDRYWWGSVSRISPEAPVPIVKLEKITFALGGAANVAANIAGLGAIPILVGLIGNDGNAKDLRKELFEANIKDDYLVETSLRPTITKTRVIAQHQQVSRIDEEKTGFPDEREANEVLKMISETLPKADIVILSDYAKDCLTNNVIRKTIELCSQAKKKVLIDPKGKDFRKYAGATILTPNKSEAFVASNTLENTNVSVEELGQKLFAKLQLEALLVTLGEAGMILFEGGREPIQIPGRTRKVYDVTGAGDTVIATLAVALGAGNELIEAAKIANICAGTVVEKLGTTAITKDDLVANLPMEKGIS